jgi:hypothetical protein
MEAVLILGVFEKMITGSENGLDAAMAGGADMQSAAAFSISSLLRFSIVLT